MDVVDFLGVVLRFKEGGGWDGGMGGREEGGRGDLNMKRKGKKK